MSDTSYLCPAGYDCMGKSSCPDPVIPCPNGYFCDSYAEVKHLKSLDYFYALYKNLFTNKVVTTSNYEKYLEPQRQIQSLCLQGFYCPNATTILPCPERHWCSEGAIAPMKCDTLSSCPEKSYYEVNYINAILALIVSVIIATASFYLNHRQKKKAIESKAFDYKPYESKRMSQRNVNALSARNLISGSPTGLEVLMINYSYEVKNTPTYGNESIDRSSSMKLLSNITAKFAAGSLTAVLGPSGCSKTTLLQAISSQSSGVNPLGNIDIYSTSVLYDSENQTDGSNVPRSEIPHIRRSIGFVPQDDVIDRNLTVRELLILNASIRQPSLTSAEVEATVEEVMLDLHIRHIADTVIGGSANSSANVSGGQLKRINIAMELVSLARPALLLLDEPTSGKTGFKIDPRFKMPILHMKIPSFVWILSRFGMMLGLDAAIANELFENLHKLSRSGITIITVLQQPREEIFYRLDEVVLMALGGHIVYQGPPQNAAERFLQHGYVQNSVSADADFCLDVLNGVVPRSPSMALVNRSSNENYLADKGPEWKEKRIGSAAIAPSEMAVNIQSNEDLGLFSDLILSWRHQMSNDSNSYTTIRDSIRRLSSQSTSSDASIVRAKALLQKSGKFLRYTYLNGKRAMVVRLRHWETLLVYAFVQMILSLALAVGFSIYLSNSYKGVFMEPVLEKLAPYLPLLLKHRANLNVQDFGLNQQQFFLSIALGMSSALTAVPLFAGRQTIIKRESLAGMPVVAYGIGSMIADTVFVYWNALLFAAIWSLFAPPGHWYHWHGAIIGIAFSSSAWGYFSSTLVSEGMSSFVALIIILICSVFGGTDPTLHQVNAYPVINWLWYLSFGTWTSESVYVIITQYLLKLSPEVASRVRDGAAHTGFQVTDFGRPMLTLFGLGLLVRGIVVYSLWRHARK